MGVINVPADLIDPVYSNIQNMLVKGHLYQKPIFDVNDPKKIELKLSEGVVQKYYTIESLQHQIDTAKIHNHVKMEQAVNFQAGSINKTITMKKFRRQLILNLNLIILISIKDKFLFHNSIKVTCFFTRFGKV